MKRPITIPYTSGWFTVVLPTVEFLLIWIGLPVLLFSLLGWSFPDWVAFPSCGVSLVIALIACVLTYPFIYQPQSIQKRRHCLPPVIAFSLYFTPALNL